MRTKKQTRDGYFPGPPGLAKHSHVSGGVRGCCQTVSGEDLTWSVLVGRTKKSSCLISELIFGVDSCGWFPLVLAGAEDRYRYIYSMTAIQIDS